VTGVIADGTSVADDVGATTSGGLIVVDEFDEQSWPGNRFPHEADSASRLAPRDKALGTVVDRTPGTVRSPGRGVGDTTLGTVVAESALGETVGVMAL
jgi:hypothetical protein